MKIDPEAAGLDEARLARIDDHLTRRYLEPGKIAGCQVLVARHGHVGHFRSYGHADLERDRPMADDTIFRIFSMSKPVTGVALLSLYEHGHFQLDDPVHRFLPQLAGLKVRERDEQGETRLVDPKRPVTVRDVMMHTSGFGYEALMGRSGRDYAASPTTTATPPPAEGEPDPTVSAFFRPSSLTLADVIDRLAERPLHFHPGTRWLYSVSTDVCGRLVEVISGQPFDEYLRTTLFEPLGMVDTGFHVPDDKVDRFAAAYRRVRPKKLALADDPYESRFRTPPAMLSGGGGLVSTAADYLRFCQMLLNGGELDGVRILGRKTVEYMSANHVNERIDKGSSWLPGQGYGFGLGFATRLETGQSVWPGSPGEFFWAGYAGTYFWIDPQEELVPVFLSQEPVRREYYRIQMRNLVYQAIIE
jgi:CubicO group peptidase (beta-lactamase class C family)